MKEKIFLFFIFLFCVNGNRFASHFLMDFFYDKPYMITAQFCWNFANIAYLLKINMESDRSKQIAIYQHSTDSFHFLSHLSNDNYFVLDLENCPTSWRILDRINSTYEFRHPLKFLLLIKNDGFENRLKHLLANYTIFPITSLTVANQIDEYFDIWQPYRIDKFSKTIWQYYGSWNTSGIQEILINIPFPERRSQFNRANMNVVLFIEFQDTWNHLEDFKNPRVDTFTKMNFGAIKALMEYCNINYTIIGVDNYGYFNQTTKSWSGLIDMVSKKKVQIAGSSPYFTIERFTVVDFIKMQNPLEIRFIMKKPPLSYMYNIFTLPFQSNVWKAIAGVLVLFFLALYINLNWEGRYYAKINEKEKFSSTDVTLIVFEAVCQQGTVTESKSASGRVLSLFMFLSFMFLYCSYSAYIVVLLQSTHKITSYEELVSSNMKAGAMETSYMRVYVAGSKKKIQIELYEKKIGPKGFYSLEEGMAKVQEGLFAFHGEVAPSYDYIVQKFTDYEICNVQIMEGYNEYLKGYTSVPKNSPYKEIFKVGLMKIEEYGIQRRNFLRFIRKPTCYSGGGSFGSVGLIDSYNALIIWGCGCGIAFIFFIFELIMYRRKIMKLEKQISDRKAKNEINYDPPPRYQNWK